MASNREGLIDRSKLSGGLTSSDAPDSWLAIEAGVLVLAAGGEAIGESNVNRVCAKIIAEGANTPISSGALSTLADRGVHVLPDIVVNVGGAAVTALMLTGLAPVERPLEELAGWLFKNIVGRIRSNMETAILRSRAEKSSLPAVALVMAEERAKSRQKPSTPKGGEPHSPISIPPP